MTQRTTEEQVLNVFCGRKLADGRTTLDGLYGNMIKIKDNSYF